MSIPADVDEVVGRSASARAMGSAATVVAARRYGLAPVVGRVVVIVGRVVQTAGRMVPEAGRVALTAGRVMPEVEVTTASGAAWPRGGAAACAGPNSASLVA